MTNQMANKLSQRDSQTAAMTDYPPYPVLTKFVRVDALDTWIKTELITSRDHV